jgi:hypothetical protein
VGGLTRAATERRLDPVEVARHGHLEIRRFAGDCMNGDSTGLEQGGLIGPGLGAIRRELAERATKQSAAHALGRLRGSQFVTIDGRGNDAVLHALDRFGDRDNRDGGTAARGCLEDRSDQRG